MQLTTKGRYAVTAMLDLASNDSSRPVTLDLISQRQNISLSYLEQLFAKLRKASLVKSIRGPGGGYLLNVNPVDVTLTEIIEAVDSIIERLAEIDKQMAKLSSNSEGLQIDSKELENK